MYFFCAGDDGCGHAGRFAPPLGHGLQRRGLAYEWPGAAYLMMGLVGISRHRGGRRRRRSTSTSPWARCCGASARDQARQQRGHADPACPGAADRRQHTVSALGFAAPGTFVLAMMFLVAFVLYYFINWKYLSTACGA
jgi:cytochrome c oxidase subunit 1